MVSKCWLTGLTYFRLYLIKLLLFKCAYSLINVMSGCDGHAVLLRYPHTGNVYTVIIKGYGSYQYAIANGGPLVRHLPIVLVWKLFAIIQR